LFQTNKQINKILKNWQVWSRSRTTTTTTTTKPINYQYEETKMEHYDKFYRYLKVPRKLSKIAMAINLKIQVKWKVSRKLFI